MTDSEKKVSSIDLTAMAGRLCALRKKIGLDQRSVAKEVGVAASALSAFENGQRIPSLEQAISLANYYGISLDSLCGVEYANEEMPERISRADVLRWFTSLCEASMPVSIMAECFDFKRDELLIPEGTFCEAKVDGLIVRIGGKWLQEFGVKYERLLRLYLEKDIDSEMLQAWKDKKYSECNNNYALGTYSEEDLPF